MHSSERTSQLDMIPGPPAGAHVQAAVLPSELLAAQVDLGQPRYTVELHLPGGASAALALPPNQPTEMVRRIALCPIPNVPAWFLGMMNLRGSLIPAFDLPSSLIANAHPGAMDSLLVIGTGESAFAITIASEPQLQYFHLLEPIPAGTATELLAFTAGAYRSGNTYWLDFDFDRWVAQLFAGAVRGRTVRRVSLQGT